MLKLLLTVTAVIQEYLLIKLAVRLIKLGRTYFECSSMYWWILTSFTIMIAVAMPIAILMVLLSRED
jgi:hypothetical protein